MNCMLIVCNDTMSWNKTCHPLHRSFVSLINYNILKILYLEHLQKHKKCVFVKTSNVVIACVCIMICIRIRFYHRHPIKSSITRQTYRHRFWMFKAVPSYRRQSFTNVWIAYWHRSHNRTYSVNTTFPLIASMTLLLRARSCCSLFYGALTARTHRSHGDHSF